MALFGGAILGMLGKATKLIGSGKVKGALKKIGNGVRGMIGKFKKNTTVQGGVVYDGPNVYAAGGTKNNQETQIMQYLPYAAAAAVVLFVVMSKKK
jgi:hypothetical protein